MKGAVCMDALSETERAELCKWCYSCEKGVDKSVTVDNPEDRSKLCQQCYSCEKGIDKSITVDSPKETTSVLSDDVARKKLCQNCYSCERGVSKDVTADTVKKSGGQATPFVWYVFVTNGCNLKCKYCYANNAPGNMTKETKDNVLTWLFKKQPYKNINVHFFGGEPTIQWDTVVDIVEIGNHLASSAGIQVGWSMTTNGVLLDGMKLDWIQAKFKKDNPFLLSIDGRPETHNKYRVSPDGRPTHHLIPVDDILKRFPNIECRPTIEADTAKDWFEDYKWLRNKGFKNIAIEPDYEMVWTEKQLRDYQNLMCQLGEYYVLSVKAGNPLPMKFIDSVRQGLRATQPPCDRMCGVAYNCGAIDHRGFLYACQRYASYNDPETYAMGDVVSGWDEYKRLKTQALTRNLVQGDISKGFNCADCPVRLFCFKGCNASNRKHMGTREISVPMYCTLTRIEVMVALYILGGMGQLQPRERRS